MEFIALGSISFLLFVIYDWNQASGNFIWIKPLFGLGCLLLVGATWSIWISDAVPRYSVPFVWMVFFLGISLLNGILLIYTLFFAVPFKKAYIEGSSHKIMTEGVYALSRHPGVLFLFLFYIFSGLALGNYLAILAGFLFTLMNLGYVLLQDLVIFPKMFSGYGEYKKTTGFIFPSRNSIRQCIRYYKKQ